LSETASRLPDLPLSGLAHADERAVAFALCHRCHVPTVELPGDQGRLDLEPTDDGYSASITCLRPDGTTAWQAVPPEGDGDAWTDVSLDGATVSATSWSCWRLQFDVVTGREIERTFTK
jgi:hypothetical protein